jgi:hypothetical protein
MTSIQTRREQVLAEAVVSAYINELSTRERPSRRPKRELAVPRASRRRRERLRPRPVLVQA